MSAAKFLTDEDVYASAAPALRKAGVDAISTREAGRLGESDESQIAWAIPFYPRKGEATLMRRKSTLPRLQKTLFKLLREMDKEAIPNQYGSVTGLSWYGGHARPDLTRPQTEPCWTLRLTALLTEEGFSASSEVPYPALVSGRRGRCDLVVKLEDAETIWIEIKGAWKVWADEKTNQRIYRSYLLHPLESGLDKTKSHAAALDIEKLRSLTSADATHVGMLLVGFDSSTYQMDSDVRDLVTLGRLDKTPWNVTSTKWLDHHRKDNRVKCWFFFRPV
jgi:hypothetical protein